MPGARALYCHVGNRGRLLCRGRRTDAVRNGPLLRVPAAAALASPFTSTSQQLIHG